MWGRSLYRNIQRFLLFQLTINVAACLIVMLGSLIGSSSPLTITQMLWVNLIMDTFAAGALASLSPSKDVMKDRPRKSGDFIITKPMATTIFIVAAIFVAVQMIVLYNFNADGTLTTEEQAWFFTFFVMLQFWNMFNAKAFMTGRSAFKGLTQSSSFILVALIILIGQYLIVTYGGEMFNVTPLSLHNWIIIIAITSPVLLIGELIRFFKK
jgi:Ca2+-transporting ATPase